MTARARRRSCDLTELTRRVRDCAPDGRTLLVGASGFEGAGKTTLAALLAERLGGAEAISVDDLLPRHLADHRVHDGPMSRSLVDAHRELVTRLVDESHRDVVLEGRHLAHPDLFGLVDVRVWLDVDTNRAAGNRISREVARRVARGDRRPYGRWSARSPSAVPPPPSTEQRFFDHHRPDRAAHALFVPVGAMVPPVELRFMDEVGTWFALWDPGNELEAGELEDLLPMPDDLRRRIKDWCTRIDTLGPGDSAADFRAFSAEGKILSEELNASLGPDWVVRWLG